MNTVVERIWELTIAEGVLMVDGVGRRFNVVKRELVPEVPNFVGFLGKNHFYISADVPEKYRLPFLAHEVRCLDDSRSGHCKRAIDYELLFVSPDDMGEYLGIRRKLFDDLITALKNSDPEMLQEFTASRDYFLRLLESN